MLSDRSTDPETSFRQQFFNWLHVSGFQFEEMASMSEFASHLQIRKEDRRPLHVVLIHIDFWNQYGSYVAWEQEMKGQERLRTSGQQVVIIWEDYWIRRQAIVQSRISAMSGISQKIAARLTQVRRIDQNTAFNFLENNHLNGSVSSKTRYGLFLPRRYYRILEADFEYDENAEELLVAVATFSAPRIFQRANEPYRSFEMVRFASLLHTNVMGGLDKLLTALIREKSPGDVMTYADLEWSEGSGYANLGFERISQTAPISFILDLKSLERKLKTLNAAEPDVRPQQSVIYNAGSAKFVKTFLPDSHA